MNFNTSGNSENLEKKIGIAEWAVEKAPTKIITLGLGSCVGVCLYDTRQAIGGMVHIMLPDSSNFKDRTNVTKFADTAVDFLKNELTRIGAKKLSAKIAGGAQMFKYSDTRSMLNIGERNVKIVKEKLYDLDIELKAERTGGSVGRTMIFELTSGDVYIKTLGKQVEKI